MIYPSDTETHRKYLSSGVMFSYLINTRFTDSPSFEGTSVIIFVFRRLRVSLTEYILFSVSLIKCGVDVCNFVNFCCFTTEETLRVI